MSDSSPNALTAAATAIDGLPAPVKTSFLSAASRLLGALVAYPAAWARRPTQAVEDITNARTLVSTELAKAVVDQAKNDPVIMQAAAEAYLPSVIQKVRNRAGVVGAAALRLGEGEGGFDRAAPPEDDWINIFMRYSEDASSDRMRDLFGRILAGQILNPGSFSPASLRAVSELDQGLAEDFVWFWEQSIGDSVPKLNQFGPGEGWAKLQRLREAGLVSVQDSAIYQPKRSPILLRSPNGDAVEVSGWNLGSNDTYLIIFMKLPDVHRVDVIKLTRVGQELSSLLNRPNFKENLLEISGRFKDQKTCAWIDLHEQGRVEHVWIAESL